MKPAQSSPPDARMKRRSAFGLCLLMFLMSMSPIVQPLESTPSNPSHATFFTPTLNATNVNTSTTGMLSISANETFSGGRLDVTPTWTDTGLTGHRFGIDQNAGWNGQHNGTLGIGHGGQLSLAPVSTLATLTDFETLVETLPDWEGQGTDHEVWNVVPLPLPGAVVGRPSNATQGQRVLATQALEGLDANMNGCLASPPMSVPAFVAGYRLTFDHWLAFQDNDAAWFEWRGNGGAWQTLHPTVAYPNASSLSFAPSPAWAGQSSAWQQAVFDLDGTVTAQMSTLEVRACFETSTSTGTRQGWFIDNFTVSNQGDQPGAWFHGNFSGSYANNADGRMHVHADVSGTTGPLELEFWANWDLEGAFSDNLMVALSVNNGTTWQSVSGIPGLPGNGLNIQGTFYTDESLGWLPVSYALPSGLASHANASSVLIEFHVQTNHQTGFGGFASSGWEGVAIDDVVIHHRRGTAQASIIPVANFTSSPGGAYGDASGWKQNSSNINEWTWTTAFGMNGPQSTTNSFEQSMVAPPGWFIEGTRPDGWEVGATRNTSGYGPGQFHSGLNGAAVNLTTKYTNNIYTHLVTQEYTIPTNASARLAFQSWVCTEANWDGGSVSISTDGGQTWWLLPPNLNGFHDQISTVNTNSPLFGEGIIDGSTVPNGCSANKNRPFELKTYDLSNLSGQAVKARFSFFSDTFVEADGWYIDDAGVEIDVFESSGTWTSPSLSPHPLFGYGWLDGWSTVPEGTTLRVDVLDAQLQPIEHHRNLTFPAHLGLDPLEHPTVHLRVNMTTNDTFVTPLIHSMALGRTVFIGPEKVLAHPDGANASSVDADGRLIVNAPFSLALSTPVACPFDGYRVTNIGDNLTWSMSQQQLLSSAHLAQPVKTTYLNYSLSGQLAVHPTFTVSASGGETVERSKAELDCVRPTENPSLDLGWNNASVFEWPPSGMSATFGLNARWDRVAFNGTSAAWDPTVPVSAYALNNSSVTLTYHALQRAGTASGQGASMTVMVTNGSPSLTLSINGVQQVLPTSSAPFTYTTPTTCPSASFSATVSSTFSKFACEVEVALLGSGEVKILNFMHLAAYKTLDMDLESSVLNDAKAASDTGDVRAVLSIPLHVRTGYGGLRAGLTTSVLPLMVETVDPPVHMRWLPESSVTFTTHHARQNPLDLTEDAPDITDVVVYLSTSASLSNAFAQVHVDRLDGIPRFRQLSGAGLSPFQADASNVTCSINGCTVRWTFASTWLLDDIDDVHVLTQATDADGLEVGPTVFVQRTPFNEVENDLEIVDFTVTDASQRRLDDWTNSFWPYHLGENQSLLATGRVRLEGISDQWADAGQGEATVTLRAVPPKNLSGGVDEWSGQVVNWSQSWTAEVEDDGWFSVSMLTPNLEENLPSNTWLEIRPSLSRRGPAEINASSSEDRSVVLNPTRLLHDTVSPYVASLTLLDSGNEVPADEHVILSGRNLPLRMALSDGEGLDNRVEIWTWLERQNDANNDGVMDPEEYTMQHVSVNRGVTMMEVDLPLIASTQVLPVGAFEGKASIVVKGHDLAGNPLEGGGDFGEEHDLATVRVQQRADTTVDIDDVRLDAMDGRLLAGHEHTLSFVLADANGLASLDRIEFALLGESEPTVCFVHFEPRFGGVTGDDTCFLETPTVVVDQRPLSTIYDIALRFRLNWTAAQTFAANGGTPALVVVDEGQDLGLGLHHLNALTWSGNTALTLRWLDIIDTMEPVGQHNETTRWFHRNDVVHHRLAVLHENTDVLAQDIPGVGHFVWELNDGERRTGGVFNITRTGELELNITMNAGIMYHDYGNVSVAPVGFEAFGLNALTYDVVLDDRSPKLVLSPGTLERLDSNQLNNISLTVSVNDDTHMGPGPLLMHSVFYRMGQPVEGTEQVDELNTIEVVNAYTVYESTVDFQPPGVALTRGDLLVVWFEAHDRSGRALTGLGTASAPLHVGLTWVAFEPVFTDLSATPYRPEVGDNVVVYARIANEGLLSGTTQAILRDDEGRMLASENISLATGEWVKVTWDVEAWKVGRLGLSVQLEGHTPQVPIPLADIQEATDDGASSSMAVLSLSMLAVVIAGAVLFIVNQKRADREEAYHLERIRRIVSKRTPPPIPWELVDEVQEE